VLVRGYGVERLPHPVRSLAHQPVLRQAERRQIFNPDTIGSGVRQRWEHPSNEALRSVLQPCCKSLGTLGSGAPSAKGSALPRHFPLRTLLANAATREQVCL
jgi:hypothetical protein